MCEDIDILEDNIEECWPGVLDILLIDHTRHQYPNAFPSSNIVWATDSYARLGDEYAAEKPILKHLITKENGKII
ncbi:MAG: restriction endonuclease subunit M, partial [Bacteroidales bacterium]|nr:restriction endonuclease subunit M [Bacteroidales bacterium]